MAEKKHKTQEEKFADYEKQIVRERKQRTKRQIDSIVTEGSDPVICDIPTPTDDEYKTLWDQLDPGDTVIFSHPQGNKLSCFFNRNAKEYQHTDRYNIFIKLDDGRELFRKNEQV